MTDFQPRIVRLVLCTPDGYVFGKLPPIKIELPWWQEVAPVVAAIRARDNIAVTILRLLETQDPTPHGGGVTYLAEVPEAFPCDPCDMLLEDDPHRLPYAKPGGPARDLAWAHAQLKIQGQELIDPPQQMRSWNLSSIWRFPTNEGDAWLKVVPKFAAPEGSLLEHLAPAPVPGLIAIDGQRMLTRAIPGTDRYDAGPQEARRMIDLLVNLQTSQISQTGKLLALGLPDWRKDAAINHIHTLIERIAPQLPVQTAAPLARFVHTLDQRFEALEACGLPDTLVHGDFHPGNLRGAADNLVLLDFADALLGHPLIDMPAFMAHMEITDLNTLEAHWFDRWQQAVPGSNPVQAALLIAPIAAARQACLYQHFLDNIEDSEQPYHRGDPQDWLQRTAAIVMNESNAPFG
ncbi:MAG: aminoglycoside phosphotransferase family protein [Cohaesibacteraceae bacterium]|nr:aminoglycoside phosphotransferase family protein [Cohaesibacteraceae bacterium]MBL4875062.1 aminoglycoside phosphotransferase family protein [Cohaesibacteraceae bacterium]